ncbi:hypothetical protein DMENIID0001_041040 [Sergentomyia squamirostris]
MNQGIIDFLAAQATPTWSLLQGEQSGVAGENPIRTQQYVRLLDQESSLATSEFRRQPYESRGLGPSSDSSHQEEDSTITPANTPAETPAVTPAKTPAVTPAETPSRTPTGTPPPTDRETRSQQNTAMSLLTFAEALDGLLICEEDGEATTADTMGSTHMVVETAEEAYPEDITSSLQDRLNALRGKSPLT